MKAQRKDAEVIAEQRYSDCFGYSEPDTVLMLKAIPTHEYTDNRKKE